jgi:5-methylcytosine-specific restriction endonuclease McrA
MGIYARIDPGAGPRAPRLAHDDAGAGNWRPDPVRGSCERWSLRTISGSQFFLAVTTAENQCALVGASVSRFRPHMDDATTAKRNAARRARYYANLEQNRERARVLRRATRNANLEVERKRERERRHAQYAADPDFHRRQYQRRNPGALTKDQVAARGAEKRAEKDRRRLERAAKAAASKDRQQEIRRAWRAANPDYMKRWRAANRDKVREAKRGRKLRKRKELVTDLTKLQRGRCAYCRAKLTPAVRHVDHIQPRARGGGNARRNLQLACAVCNVAKGAKDPIIFAQEIGRLL